jgi:hypothetical protein
MLKKLFTLPNVTLLVALVLSSIAAWFAIVGLVAIFPSKATAIIVMGGAIEVGKVVTTIWLRKYWNQAGAAFKLTLIPMVCILMLLTSMGTFGFLSAAHSEQSAISGDATSKVAIIDEKIKTQRDNIDIARKALSQMDAQVEQVLTRSDSERGAERAVQIRRQQLNERNRIQQEITSAQNVIAKLNEERAPIASEVRKLEAEVGPIKYIAALVYGDNPDANVLEKAVRLVIILLVLVFDPLAIALVLAGNASKKWENEEPLVKTNVEEKVEPSTFPVVDSSRSFEEKSEFDLIFEEMPELSPEDIIMSRRHSDSVVGATPWPTEWNIDEDGEHSFIPQNTYSAEKRESFIPQNLGDFSSNTEDLSLSGAIESDLDYLSKSFDINEHPYLFNVPTNRHPPGIELAGPQVYKEAEPTTVDSVYVTTDGTVSLGSTEEVMDLGISKDNIKDLHEEIMNEFAELFNVPTPTTLVATPDTTDDTVNLNPDQEVVDLQLNKSTVKYLHDEIMNGFGTEFPKITKKGTVFVKVDTYPHKVYKFDGKTWNEIDKSYSDSYIQNVTYLQFLIKKIENGECDVETLTDVEKEYISLYLEAQQ